MKNILTAMLLLTLLGCGSPSGRPIIEVEFREGTQGLAMEFLENAPPEEAYEDSEVLIGLDVSNIGATHISGGIFALSLEDELLTINDWKGWLLDGTFPNAKTATFSIEGKSQNFPEGGQHRMTISGTTGVLDTQTETRTTNIIFTACYPYQTVLVQEVCVDPDPLNTIVDKPCEVDNMDFSSQGAPVAITQIEPLMLESLDDGVIRPQFTLIIKNTDDGTVFNSGSVQEACSSDELQLDDIGVIDINVRLLDQTLECKPQPLRLRKGEAKARCQMPSIQIGSSGFIAALVVTLDYGYSDTISQNLVIRRLE